MDERYSTQRLRGIRKVSRSMADFLRGRVAEYVTTLNPLLRPRSILGDHVRSSSKDTIKGADAALKEVQTLYTPVAASNLYELPRELPTPLSVLSASLDLAPVEYTHVVRTNGEGKMVSITAPLRWVLHYSGFTPRRVRELLAERNRTGDALQQAVLHYLMLHVVVTRQPAILELFKGLRFPISMERFPEYGDLPITLISAPVATLRPADEVIIENTEISGTDAFEEVIDLDQFAALRDPLHDRLRELAQGLGEDA